MVPFLLIRKNNTGRQQSEQYVGGGFCSSTPLLPQKLECARIGLRRQECTLRPGLCKEEEKRLKGGRGDERETLPTYAKRHSPRRPYRPIPRDIHLNLNPS